MARTAASFEGSVTTTGRSEALRLEKSFFKANPEFRQRARVRAQVIGHGKVLVSVEDDPDAEDAVDPVVGAWLAFLERDMREHPGRLSPFSADEVHALNRLVADVAVSDDERLPEDVTF